MDECPHRDDHPEFRARLDNLEKEVDSVKGSAKDMAETLASLKGWIAGAIAIAGAIGALAGLFSRAFAG